MTNPKEQLETRVVDRLTLLAILSLIAAVVMVWTGKGESHVDAILAFVFGVGASLGTRRTRLDPAPDTLASQLLERGDSI